MNREAHATYDRLPGTESTGVGQDGITDGKLEVLLGGIKPIKNVSLIAPTTALAISEDATAYQVDTRSRAIA